MKHQRTSTSLSSSAKSSPALRCITSPLNRSAATFTGCDQKNQPVAADNTARNTTDRSGSTKTPMDQSESAASIKITADVRRAIMDDKSMSTRAQNCKVITDKAGRVTLRGVVSSQAEKDSIQAKATAVAGVTNVDNQLEVKVN